MRGGKGFPHYDCELSIYEWIPWYNTMQIQLVISLLYKQLISCLPPLMTCWQTHGVKHWSSWTTVADNLFTLLSQQSRDKGLIRSSSVEGSQQCGSGLKGGNVSCYLPPPRWEWQVIHEVINKQHGAIVYTKKWNSRIRFDFLDCWFEGFGLLVHVYSSINHVNRTELCWLAWYGCIHWSISSLRMRLWKETQVRRQHTFSLLLFFCFYSTTVMRSAPGLVPSPHIISHTAIQPLFLTEV